MFIRNYKEHERTKLSEWLSETDDPSDCSYLTSFNTFILEDDEEIGFFTITMWAFSAIGPNNGFKKAPTCIFIWKPFFKFVDVHGISSFF